MRRCNMDTFLPTLLHTNAFTHGRFYTQSLPHIDAFTDRQTLLQTDRCFYRQTDRRLYTQKLFHTDAFTHRSFYTEAFTHRRFYRQALLHTDAFTHRRFYTLAQSTSQYYFVLQNLHRGREGQLGVVIGCTPGNGRIKNDPQPWLVNRKAQLLGLPHYMKVTCYRTKMLLKHWKWAYNQQTLTTNGE